MCYLFKSLFSLCKNQCQCIAISYQGCDYTLSTEWIAIPSCIIEFQSSASLAPLSNATRCCPFVLKLVNPDSVDPYLVNAYYDSKCKVLYVQGQEGSFDLLKGESFFFSISCNCIGFVYSNGPDFTIPCQGASVPLSAFSYLDSSNLIALKAPVQLQVIRDGCVVGSVTASISCDGNSIDLYGNCVCIQSGDWLSNQFC